MVNSSGLGRPSDHRCGPASPGLTSARSGGKLRAPVPPSSSVMTLGATDLWNRILEQARTGLPDQAFRTWISSSRVVSWSGGVLHVAASSRFHAEWLEDKYGQVVQDIAQRLTGEPVELRITSEEPAVADGRSPEITVTRVVEPEPAPQPSSPPPSPPPGLNARYTFDRFIVGDANRLAQAASLAVADRPARLYNPLFLYGSTGLGKTHLMQAIANRMLVGGEAARICYIPAEQFVNEMVTAIYEHSTDAFRARYRSHDLLLVDDVQFLRRKEHTQEEFFHTFNVLYNAGRQIVLTSDRHPKELEGLEERLVSRFEWGLVADVGRPDYETRVAILRRKADEDRVFLAPEILDLIACRCKSSVRELEGAIIKLLAFSSLTRQELTLDLAQVALQGLGDPREPHLLNPTAIRDEVGKVWGVTGAALASGGRSRTVTVPRQVAMFLIRELLDTPLKQIGRVFGGRDHSTVIHSIRKVEERLGNDDAFRAQVDDLRQTLQKSA
ncbi:MAG: chromosomal replication initiator protein DnaA [Gemmatimonadetes bacterium]|nr:chromosomal replication initiator protein DnaA [Gemmatimonadota bacterium]MYB98627.1 chromosomal replication initiator protein DnaA [Gemmatimonadota bacterium]